MAAWAGFSDEDLRKVKNLTNTSTPRPQQGNTERVKKASFGREKHERGPPRRQVSIPSSKHSEIDTDMKLQKEPQLDSENSKNGHKIPKEKHDNKSLADKGGTKTEVDEDRSHNEHEVEGKVSELDDKEALERDMKSLENFRNQQKVIEEANKQKKALLAKTLTERKKKAQKEAYKLEHIQKELSKLDSLLTADVQVIRNKIEDASREFLDAQRRFEKAEVEYIASKVDLHSKSELKEQLTEHLYTIIHQNEVRKAKKLADLMKELEMDNSEEEFNLPELPPLSSFQPASTSLSPTGSAPSINRSQSSESNEVKQTVKHNENNESTANEIVSQKKSDSEESVEEKNSLTSDSHSDIKESLQVEGISNTNPNELEKLSSEQPVEKESNEEKNTSDKIDKNSVIKTSDKPSDAQNQPTAVMENGNIKEIPEEITNATGTKLPDSWNFNPVTT